MKLKLHEIIWEITNKCNNNCSYCGSKEITTTTTPVADDHYKKMIDRIAEYPPDILDVSGGDPLLVGYEVHLYLREKLKTTKCNILINPLSLRYKTQKMEIVNLYPLVGVSLNTEDEIRAFEEIRDKISSPITFITNFSLLNLYLVDTLSDVIRNNPWQIQFTMSRDQTITIYDKTKALEKLNLELGKRKSKGWPIIVADNASADKSACTAGINAIGILYDGSIVPCLSMRSWCSNISAQIQGNIKTDDLKTVWLTKFQDSRFDDCDCCKDFCHNALIQPIDLPPETPVITVTDLPWVTMQPKYAPIPPYPVVSVYAVFTPPDGFPSPSFTITSDSGVLGDKNDVTIT